jgi:hypothetical protein
MARGEGFPSDVETRPKMKGEEVAMRVRKAFLSCAILAGILLAATGATAAECKAGNYTVTTPGPSFVSCGMNCTATAITYTVSGGATPDHVATVVASGSTNCLTPSILEVTGAPASGNQPYDPGVGDPVTELGKRACHEEAAKINPHGSVVEFTVKVSGRRSPAPKSVVVKKGNKIKSCEIVGIGEAAGETAPVTETLTLTSGNCSVVFTLDEATNTVLDAQLTEDSADDCDFEVNDTDAVKIVIDGKDSGSVEFGDGGYIQHGSSSCITRVFGGRAYTWGPPPCP